MKRQLRSLWIVGIVLLLATAAMAGCSNNRGNNDASPDNKSAVETGNEQQGNSGHNDNNDNKAELKEVELKMYLLGDPPGDLDLVLEELNKKIKADMNATLKVNYISWADLSTKYPLLLSSGETFDMIYTSNWAYFKQEVQKGGFMALDELLPQYAPELYKAMPQEAWEQSSYEGNIYMIPQESKVFVAHGMMYRDDLREKYDLPKITDSATLGVYMKAIKENEPDMLPYNVGGSDMGSMAWWIMRESDRNWNILPGLNNPGLPFVYDQDQPSEIYLASELPEYKSFVERHREWSQQGFWSKSALSNKTKSADLMLNGKSAVAYMNLTNANIQAQKMMDKNPEWKVDWFVIGGDNRPYPQAPYTQDGMAINRNAENPERALMLLEKLHMDKDYFTLTTYGVEGKHYAITADGKLTMPEGVSADNNKFPVDSMAGWGWKSDRFLLEAEEMWQPAIELEDRIAEKLFIPKLINFTPDLSVFKSELAAAQNVMKQHGSTLNLGLVDPEQGLAELNKNLKAAGIDKIKTELKKQVEAYLAKQ